MDAMALLCNLQADGPATLRKLHKLGCTTLDDLNRVPVFELAEALGSDAGFAQRFLREARLLRQRFGSAAPEPEEARVPLPTPAEEHAVRIDSIRVERTRIESKRVELTQAPAHEPDFVELTVREATRPAAPPIVNRPLKALSMQPPGTPLRANLVEGLDSERCKALIGQGILNVETLVDAPGLALARAIGISYTSLLDLQCMAKRFLAQQGATITIEREGASAPEVVRTPDRERPRTPSVERRPESTPATRAPALRPMEEPDYTIFPPRPQQRTGAAPSRPAPTTPTSKREEQDAGIGGPFA